MTKPSPAPAASLPRTHNLMPERRAFYDEIAPSHLAPLWEVLGALVTPEPRTTLVPHLWRYADIRPYLVRSSELITAKEAERRVLVLENPSLPGQSCITRSLYAGLQVILPGEIAPPHRHTQTALRFVIEGQGAYTGVDGERTEMRPGDFVITPSWTWHDHGSHGKGPTVWLDVLDIPMLQFFEASFREGSDSDEARAEERPQGDSLARYGSNLLPVENGHAKASSPVFNYPYDRTRAALEQMRKREEWSPWHGLKMKYVNPINGDYAIPTIATFIQLLPKGFGTQPYRATDGTVFVCVEGKGQTKIGDKTFAWGPRDVFVVPSWMTYTHEASEDAVLFSASDRGVQEKLGLWREEKR